MDVIIRKVIFVCEGLKHIAEDALHISRLFSVRKYFVCALNGTIAVSSVGVRPSISVKKDF